MTTTQTILIILGTVSLSYHICRFIFWLDEPKTR